MSDEQEDGGGVEPTARERRGEPPSPRPRRNGNNAPVSPSDAEREAIPPRREPPLEANSGTWTTAERLFVPPGAPAPVEVMAESDEFLTPNIDFKLDALTRPVPPRKRTVIKHSFGFYVFVAFLFSGGSWLLYLRLRDAGAGGNPVTAGLALGVTAFWLLVLVLRLTRGSMLEAEDKARTNLVYRPTPSDRIAKRLHGGEYVLFETKLHPLSIAPTIISRLFHSKLRRRLFFGYIVALATVWTGHQKTPETIGTGWLAGLALLPLLFLSLSVYEWTREQYALTSERLIGITGIVSTHLGEMPRSRMTDVGIDTPWYSNLLAWCRFIDLPFGTWDVESAGQEQRLKRVPGVPKADLVATVFGLAQRPRAE